MGDKFTYAECFQIDPEGKNVLFVYYPANIDPERLENMKEAISRIRDELDKWAKEPDSPIYTLCLPWDVRIKIGKVTKYDAELSREERAMAILERIADCHCIIREERHGLIRNYCFFCGHDLELCNIRDTNRHAKDCLYIAALGEYGND